MTLAGNRESGAGSETVVPGVTRAPVPGPAVAAPVP